MARPPLGAFQLLWKQWVTEQPLVAFLTAAVASQQGPRGSAEKLGGQMAARWGTWTSLSPEGGRGAQEGGWRDPSQAGLNSAVSIHL